MEPSLLLQFRAPDGARGIAFATGADPYRRVAGADTTLELAALAIGEGTSLQAVASARLGETIDPAQVELLCAVDHPDPAHVVVAGTGLTHLGSAQGRDEMHRKQKLDPAPSDSMKMFLMGLEGGKPEGSAIGAQPEWFYKGDGSILRASGSPLLSPSFALDAGEEPELAGIYLIAPDGRPVRLGVALGNEFSDHVTERGNYLWLAHSKLRQTGLGAELLLGPVPQDVRGTSRIVRGGEVLWEKPFLTGEDNMSHSIANLEHHHFKYELFRRPGDVHVHFFGTATASFADGISTQEGDVFEIEAAPFRLPLRNAVSRGADEGRTEIAAL